MKESGEGTLQITILMPCLNEEKTLRACILEARAFLEKNHMPGEILIADNHSTDNSVKIAKRCGARVVVITKKGYGNALLGGIKEAKGKYIVFGDCDGSYDFSRSGEFIKKLEEGYDLVVGNRFAGGMEPGAMPLLHKIGVPFLSWIGRWRYHSKIRDFHCGLRGVRREAVLKAELKAPGMEFSTEMIGKMEEKGFRVTQIPTPLRRDKRNGKSHLRCVRDGVRHLRLMLKR